ncbi:MAG: leucine-rich repeat domain-containing protein, partial [Bacteroidetes bacterium]|nr:leucine-rich repeat domain-containing protein [Bacteroidota bacterium]
LYQLQSLNLNHNQLKQLPEDILQLRQLQSLSLRYNGLDQLPESFGQLQQLKSLDLGYNNFSQLPDFIEKLTNLEKLYLENIPISETELRDLQNALPKCAIIYKSPEEIQAYNLAKNKVEVERYQRITADRESDLRNGKAIDSTRAATNYNSLGWYQLLTGQFTEAEVAIRRGMELDSTYIFLHTNLPTSLLLQGKVEEARKLYIAWKDKPFQDKTYRSIFLGDLEKIEEAGIIPPELKEAVEEIRQLLQKE